MAGTALCAATHCILSPKRCGRHTKSPHQATKGSEQNILEKKMIKKVLAAAMLAASLGSIAVPASADIVIRIAPPAARMEVVPDHRPGRVWVAGHWTWRNHKHVWVKGTWVRERN